jgi:hypothetical protein
MADPNEEFELTAETADPEESWNQLAWHEIVRRVTPYVVRIKTSQGSGTGFLVSRSAIHPLCGIATAAHVIDHAHYWEQPIRIEHHQSGKSVLLRPGDRGVILEAAMDTAAIVFDPKDFPFPQYPPPLIPEGYHVATGGEVAWLGFPAVAPPDQLCFFHGRISAPLLNQHSYLVDGVAINGVSGGPTLFALRGGYSIVGVVSAYVANRATGEILPGVAVVRDVTQFHETIRSFQSLDDAKKNETPPQAPPPPPSTSSAT